MGALLPPALTGGPPATARWGRGDAFVVEADEYAGNFDPYRPAVAVLLNAEWDHPDVFADEAAVLDAFEAWLRGAGRGGPRRSSSNVGDAGRARGSLTRLGDWPGTRRARGARCGRRPSGRDAAAARARSAADVAGAWTWRRTLGPRPPTGGCACRAARRAGTTPPTRCAWPRPPRVLGVAAADIAAGLATFAGVGRRLEVKGEPRGVLVLDDYGHHPTAIAATLAAVRERYPGPALWAVYEPLTYHRTAAMLDAFADVLATADQAVIADIWAGRDPDTTITSAAALAAAITRARRRAGAGARQRRGDRRLPGRRACGRATSCWSWAAAAPTSSPSGSWRPSAAGPSGVRLVDPAMPEPHARRRAGPARALQARLGAARRRTRSWRCFARRRRATGPTRSSRRSAARPPSARSGTTSRPRQAHVGVRRRAHLGRPATRSSPAGTARYTRRAHRGARSGIAGFMTLELDDDRRVSALRGVGRERGSWASIRPSTTGARRTRHDREGADGR